MAQNLATLILIVECTKIKILNINQNNKNSTRLNKKINSLEKTQNLNQPVVNVY